MALINSLNKEKVVEALSQVVNIGKIAGIVVDGGKIGFAIEDNSEELRKACEKAVFAIPGVEKVTAVLTAPTGKISVENKNAEVLNRKMHLPGVKKIIAIASGKGGVGKSTLALNIALAAAKSGAKVGLVDADIYGPSIAHMLGLSGKKPETAEAVDGKQGVQMIPAKAQGIYGASMGMLLGDNQPAIWRGPMATKAIHQLFQGVAWDVDGEMDVLFIDMPPGTGDIHLSIAQHYFIDGAVIITTPHELALLDVKKAVTMFEKVGIPVLGVVENMSYFVDSAGNKNYPFGQGGGAKMAKELSVGLLAEIPLEAEFKFDFKRLAASVLSD